MVVAMHVKRLVAFLLTFPLLVCGCNGSDNNELEGDGMRIIFLHHSTGNTIWKGGVKKWFKDYNSQNKTKYKISEQEFPKESPYGWNNYPFDYWNIWVNNAGTDKFKNEPTLEILTKKYNVIVWKHCFPVSSVEAENGPPDITSDRKTIQNYKLQYEALKSKIHQFPAHTFVLWTAAALTERKTSEQNATRTKEFVDWVRNEWDETGDNIFLWDFYELETEGGLYLKDEFAVSPTNSHPNEDFARRVAPLFCRRVVDAIEGRGDDGSVTGK